MFKLEVYHTSVAQNLSVLQMLSSIVFLVAFGLPSWILDFGVGQDLVGTGVCFAFFYYIYIFCFWLRVLD